MTSSRLEVILYSLERYTNYSIQVLAYTRKGEGVRSDPIYVTTQQDGESRVNPFTALPGNKKKKSLLHGQSAVFSEWLIEPSV